MAEQKTPEASFQFVKMQVKESHIEFKSEGQYSLSVMFDPSGVFDKTKETFTLNLHTTVYEEEQGLSIKLSTESTFKYSIQENEDELRSYFTNNAPAIVFPYIRSYISALTALSGMQTITMPTLNTANISRLLANNIQVIDEA